MYKIINIGIPKYLTHLIPKREIVYNIRNRNKSFFHCRSESFKNSFFPYTIEVWYSLDPWIINSNSLEIFKSKLLGFIRAVQRSIYNVFNPQGLEFLTRLRLGLSLLNEHRFIHNFKDCINPLSSCSLEVENTLHFFLRRQPYSTFRMGLMNKADQSNLSYLSDENKVSLLLYGDSRFDGNKSNSILSTTIIILETERFLTSLFQSDVWIFISSDTFHLVILFSCFIYYSFYVSLIGNKISIRTLLNVFYFGFSFIV